MKQIYYLSIILCLAIFSIYFYNFPLNEDSVWIVYSTQNMLHGATLYTDIVEVNPPLIFILNTIPVFVAELIGMNIAVAYLLFTLFLAFVSLYLSGRVFTTSNLFSQKQYYLLQMALLFTFIILPSEQFGEREHLFMVFVFPYILMMMFQDRATYSKKLTLAITIFAVFGFNLKPHFFLIFLVCELVYLSYHRSFKQLIRPQALIIGFSGVIYLGIIYIYFQEYLSFLLPLAIEAYSDVFELPFLSLLLSNPFDILFIIMFTIYFFLFAYKRHSFDLTLLISLVLPMLVLYFYQQKGWHYHLLPAIMFTNFAFMYILISHVKKEYYKFAVFAAVFLVVIIYDNRYFDRYKNFTTYLNTLQENTKIVVLTMDIAQGLPLVVQSHHRWASRFPSLWMLPKTIEDPSKTEIQSYMLNAIYEDLLSYKPDYIIINPNIYKYTIQKYQPLRSIIKSDYKEIKSLYTIVYQRDKED